MFARGRPQVSPTDKQYLICRKQRDNPEQIFPWELTEEVRRTTINDPDLYAMVANALEKEERCQEEYAEEIANVAHKLTSEHTKIECVINRIKKEGKT